MILRYKTSLGGAALVTLVQSNTQTSTTTNTVTYTVVIQGPPSAVVGFKVTILTQSVPGTAGMTINSNPQVINSTFSGTLDAVTGLLTLTQVLTITSTPGTIESQVTIETTSIGVISPVLGFWDNTKNF
jgi:hypothetical protein